MGARRWENIPKRISPRHRRVERALLGPAMWLAASVLDRRLRRALEARPR
ncbi:MAG: hypothetical protein LC722_02195 [Actinobacteria bacterium]|nr:hypothetical protein [Actinomycetota bacterium]